MSRKLLFLINPVSGTGNKEKIKKIVSGRCRKEGVEYEIIPTRKDGDYKFLKVKINSGRFTDIIICGGDGSIAPVVSAVRNCDVSVGLIPVGSGNGLARTAGIPCNLKKAVDNIFEGKAQKVDAYNINGKMSCHLFGLGFDGQIAEEFSDASKRGLPTYLTLVVKGIFDMKTYDFNFEIDGYQFDSEGVMLTVANSNQFGNSIRIAPHASIRDGWLDFVLVKGKSFSKIALPMIDHMFLNPGRAMSPDEKMKKKVIYYRGKEFRIENPGLAPAHIDGEPSVPLESYDISIIPEAYRLIMPGG